MLEKCELSATFCRLEAVVDRSTRTAYTDGFTVLACLLPGYFPSNIIKDTIMFRYPPMHTHSRTHTCIRTRKHIYTHIYIHSLKPRHKSCSFTHTYYARTYANTSPSQNCVQLYKIEGFSTIYLLSCGSCLYISFTPVSNFAATSCHVNTQF